MKTDKKIDAYIMKSADFARPILEHIRALVHKSCPDVEETWKWSFPHFMYKDAILCSMAAFKNHCAFGFWKGSLIPELSETINDKGETAMGQFGRIQSLKDLPSAKVFSGYIKKAMKLSDDGIKLPAKAKPDKPKVLKVPDYLTKAIAKNEKAKTIFDSFSFTNKKDYVEWITEAKTDDTRNKRMRTAIEWMAEGKTRHWKYKNC